MSSLVLALLAVTVGAWVQATIGFGYALLAAPLVALVFVIGFFPNLFLSRMSEGVAASIQRFEAGRRAYSMDPERKQALMIPRLGGPMERGYPEPKTAPAAAAAEPAQALNAAEVSP